MDGLIEDPKIRANGFDVQRGHGSSIHGFILTSDCSNHQDRSSQPWFTQANANLAPLAVTPGGIFSTNHQN
jgi:hypothetical protein